MVTLNTIKKSTSNVYGKLGVCSRTQAIARVRELNLLQFPRSQFHILLLGNPKIYSDLIKITQSHGDKAFQDVYTMGRKTQLSLPFQ